MADMITIPKGGRPHNPNKPDDLTLHREYIEEGQTSLSMALKYGVSPSTMARWLREAGCRKRG